MPESLTGDPSGLRALVQTPLRTPSALRRYQAAPGRLEVDGDVVLLASAVPGPDYNFVTVLGPATPEHVFARAEAFYGGEPYGVIVEVEQAGTLEAALRAAGWELDEEEPALVLTPLPPGPPPPAELAIQRVATEAALDAFFAITGTSRHRVPSVAAALDPDVALFVGYVAGVPVATSRITVHGPVGDINGVVTKDEYRRRGFGAAMTWAAITYGRGRGCTAMTLTATAMGYPVYRRMGFVPVCAFRTYLPPAVDGRR